jgi:uncharacterized membrane protein
MVSAQKKDKEIEEGKFFAVISYIAFLCIVSLVLKKDNKFALFHAKQGLVLFVFEVAAFIFSVIPLLGGLIKILGGAVFMLISLWAVLQALMGNYSRIPVVDKIADKIIL